MNERWLPVVDWEDLYEVSDHGRVRSLPRTVDNGYRTIHRRLHILKPGAVGHMKYLQVVLCRDTFRKQRKVHHLVLETFVGACPPGMQTCHNDGDVNNNRLSNLRWDTQSANAVDMVGHGTHNQARKTHCPRGHRYTAANTHISSSKGYRRRHCKRCWTERREVA